MSVAQTRPPVNILLVDDQPAKLLSYETILASLGENLIRANSGSEALDQLLRREIAVVLVDVCMPELDGFELAAMIRNHPRFQKTAIILVSGVLVDDRDRLKGYDSGAVDYVSVPIVPEILRAKVSVFAELFRKTHELQRLNAELERRVAERTAEIAGVLEAAQQARKEAEIANRLKDEFLATLSHELRTPLNAITGWAEMMRAGVLDEEGQTKAVETICRNAKLQNQLISDILDVSRIIAGKLRLEMRSMEVEGAIRAAVDTLRPAAKAKGVRLTVKVADGAGSIMGDAARLQQIVCNLLSNAIKFGPEKGRVKVAVAASDADIEVSVQDEGPGIKPEFLPHVFERFRQADSSSTRPHHGLGLGLAIVRHLVELHAGSVSACNRSDRSGAIFSFRLPREGSHQRGPEPARARDRESGVSLSPAALEGLRVLVVDDEPDGREVASTILQNYGATVVTAASAAEAYGLFESERPDVLITDIEMPDEDGYGLLTRIRAHADGASIPAMALTAYASSQDRAKALEAGFEIHCSKPVQPAALAAAVNNLARRRVTQAS